MLKLVFVILLLILTVVSFALHRGAKAGLRRDTLTRTEREALDIQRLITAVARWVLLALAVIVGFFAVVRVVPANNVGIPTNFGDIGSPMNSGIHFTAPWTKVNNFSTRVQELSMLRAPDEGDKSKDDSIQTIARGGGAMSVDLTVRYFVVEDNADVLFRQAGTMDLIAQRFVRPDAREVTRNVFSLYTAEEGYSTKRAEISQEIFKQLGPRLLTRGILVDSINVRDVSPEATVLTAINAILQTRNDGLKALEDQKKQVTEAETRKQVAERDKAATITKAEGSAESVRIAADAQAAANTKLAASLTPTLADLEKARLCADAIARTQATVVNVCGEGDGSGVTASAAGVIVDARK